MQFGLVAESEHSKQKHRLLMHWLLVTNVFMSPFSYAGWRKLSYWLTDLLIHWRLFQPGWIPAGLFYLPFYVHSIFSTHKYSWQFNMPYTPTTNNFISPAPHWNLETAGPHQWALVTKLCTSTACTRALPPGSYAAHKPFPCASSIQLSCADFLCPNAALMAALPL